MIEYDKLRAGILAKLEERSPATKTFVIGLTTQKNIRTHAAWAKRALVFEKMLDDGEIERTGLSGPWLSTQYRIVKASCP